MNILFITHLYPPAVGGAERVFSRIAEGLAGRGHAVTVLTSDALSTEQYYKGTDTNLPAREMLQGVEILRETIRSPIYRHLRIIDRVLRLNRRLGVPPRPLVFGPHFPGNFPEVRRRDFDIVIAGPTPTTTVFYGFLYKRRRPHTRFIVFPHMHTRDRLHNTYVNRWVLRRADGVFALSKAEEKRFLRIRVRHRRIHRIVNAVDDIILDTPRSETEKTAGDPWSGSVLYLGQEGSHKKIPLLLKAVNFLWKEGRDIRLVIAGARTDFSPTLDRIIDGLPERNRNRVARYNNISEMEKIERIDGCRVLVNPSAHEAFGLVFLEAWARRKPVIGARIEAVQEVIRDGINGLLFSNGDAVDLKGKIARLIDDEQLAEDMGNAGYREVLKNYRWNDVLDRIESVLEAECRRRC